jgi:FAD/FMN-containing dehydrogenase
MPGDPGWAPAVPELQTTTRGRPLVHGDEEYDESRRVFNPMIDRYPALILRCEDTQDVVQAVRFAHERGLAVSVKGGGLPVGQSG